MPKSSVSIPFPASPDALNIIGTFNGNVASTRNFCSGAVPVNLDTSKLSSSRFMFCLVFLLVVLRKLFMSKSSDMASAASQPSGLPLGGVNIVTDLAPALSDSSCTSSATLLPAVSLSCHKITSLPCRGEKSYCVADFFVSIPAPPIVQVAVCPMLFKASAHFSPSTHITLSEAKMFGILYNGLTSGIRGYGWSPVNCLNSFFGLPCESSIGLPAPSRTRYFLTKHIMLPSEL